MAAARSQTRTDVGAFFVSLSRPPFALREIRTRQRNEVLRSMEIGACLSQAGDCREQLIKVLRAICHRARRRTQPAWFWRFRTKCYDLQKPAVVALRDAFSVCMQPELQMRQASPCDGGTLRLQR